jgi:hypothetical protein
MPSRTRTRIVVLVVVSFPVPCKPWSTNASGQMHWAKRYKHIQAWRDAAHVAALNTLRQMPLPVSDTPSPANVRIDIPFARNARRDPHNYVGTVCKAIVDGLVRAKLWPDDGPEYVTVMEPRLVIDPEAWVIVNIEERT